MTSSKNQYNKNQTINNSDLVMLHEFALILNSSFDIEQILMESAKKIKEITRSDGCHILFSRRLTDRLKLETVVHDGEKQLPTTIDVTDGAVVKTTFSTGEIIIIDDTANDPRIIQKLREHVGHRSMASVPVIVRGEVIGVIVVYSKIPAHYNQSKGRFLTMLGSHLGLAVENANLMLELQKAAIIDSLTGTYNRRYFKLELDSVMDECSNGMISFIMIDLDNFKSINDTFGHLAGDYVLREIAGVLKVEVRAEDTVIRYGGDEFAIVLPDTDEEVAGHIAVRIEERVANHTYIFNGCEIRVGMSWGAITMNNNSIKCVNDIVRLADKRLYDMKNKKKRSEKPNANKTP